MAAMFDLVGGGIGVMPDPADNPNNRNRPAQDAGVKITFEVLNVGDAGGNATVGIEVDDTFVIDWQSSFLDPGGSEKGSATLGRLSQGDHAILIYVNPGSGTSDHEENNVIIA